MSNMLTIDDDVAIYHALQLHFRSHGHDVEICHNAEEGMEAERSTPNLVVLDIQMPGASGLEALPEFKRNHADVPVIIITAFDDMGSTVEAMKNGANDCIRNSIDIDELDSAVANALMGVQIDDRSQIMADDERYKPS